jgi:NAD(P) transhydrogenase subunit alpha
MCHDDGTFELLAAQGVDSFALEMMPRLSRAQTMDVLSSQANIAGYRAVVLGAGVAWARRSGPTTYAPK